MGSISTHAQAQTEVLQTFSKFRQQNVETVPSIMSTIDVFPIPWKYCLPRDMRQV